MSTYEISEKKRRDINDKIIEQFTEQQNEYEKTVKLQSFLSSQQYHKITILIKEIEQLKDENKKYINKNFELVKENLSMKSTLSQLLK